MISVCDQVSLGLGYEMGTVTERHGKPHLALAHHDSLVTDMILGIDHPSFKMHRYRDLLRDGVEAVRAFLEQVHQNDRQMRLFGDQAVA